MYIGVPMSEGMVEVILIWPTKRVTAKMNPVSRLIYELQQEGAVIIYYT